MGGRRVCYLAALAAGVIFYIAYQEWLSWLILMLLVFLPVFSLAVSLPAILRFRMAPAGPDRVEMGGEALVRIMGWSGLPVPPFQGRLCLRHTITGQTWTQPGTAFVPTAHCGGITAQVEKGKVCDYLGLFAFRVKDGGRKTLLIQPQPMKVWDMPDVDRFLARSWRPKPGGGYAENHELRLYRPGDGMNQVHWKLTAKTGKLIIREPMRPDLGRVLVTMNLRGAPDCLDRKLGRLLWLGNYLLSKGLSFELRVLTGNGLLTWPIGDPAALSLALDQLLLSPAAAEGDVGQMPLAAAWYYHIGGDPDGT